MSSLRLFSLPSRYLVTIGPFVQRATLHTTHQPAAAHTDKPIRGLANWGVAEVISPADNSKPSILENLANLIFNIKSHTAGNQTNNANQSFDIASPAPIAPQAKP